MAARFSRHRSRRCRLELEESCSGLEHLAIRVRITDGQYGIPYLQTLDSSQLEQRPILRGLARQFDASLHLVYVVEPTIYPADLGFGQVVLPGVEEELRQKGADELRELIREEIGARVKATYAVKTGTPSQEILGEAEEKRVNMIVIATHGHSGLEHVLFGSTAERIVRKAQCPVLTIRPVRR